MSLRQAIDDLQRCLQRQTRRFHYYLRGEDLSFLEHTELDQLPQRVRQLQDSADLTLIDQQEISYHTRTAVETLRFLKREVSLKFQWVIERLRDRP